MDTYTKAQILAATDPKAVIAAIAEGFVAYSRGEVELPPVGHLAFRDPPGDLHIKFGHRHGDPVFVVKIASGFYQNTARGLSSSNGLNLVFSAQTGVPVALLLDEGYLTDLRTAAAGAVAAKYLAPKSVTAIGIIGAGIQAHLQLDLLRHVTSVRRAIVWARDPAKAAAFAVAGFRIETARTPEELAKRCNLIVTATCSREPLLWMYAVQPGTHITAVGADAPGKQELDPQLFARAAVCAVDSRNQCFEHGDSSHAIRARSRSADQFVELGEVVENPTLGRADDAEVTIADLTGLAIQDIQISKLVCEAITGKPVL